MAKWSEYLISAVSFNAAHTHIDRVRAHQDLDTSVAAGSIYERSAIVDALKKGTTFSTIFKDSAGKWKLGQKVEIVTIGGTDFIKTLADSIRADNLDNLPEF